MLVKRFVLLYTNFMTLEGKIAQILINTRKTIAIAESCTGGHLSNRLTNIPGSSLFLKMAIVAYSNEAKIKILKIPRWLIRQHGAVSQQVAIAMAKQARNMLDTDLGVGITGIAGPSGGTKTKPVGLAYIAVCTQVESLCLGCHFRGTRSRIKNHATTRALRLLYKFLS